MFFGTPQFAVPTFERLLASSHHVVGVFTQPDRPRGRGQHVTPAPIKASALAHGVPVFQPDRLREPSAIEALAGLAPDLGVVAAYGKLLPVTLLEVPRQGMINVHASLLPKYRGAAPVHRAVMAGETLTGVTIMRVIRELDAGGMFARATRPIGPDETSDAVEHDLARIGADLLVAVVNDLAVGHAREEPQDDREATYAPRLTKDEGLIDWSQPAATIHNQVRGLHPWPHAYTFIAGHRVIVRRSCLPDRSVDALAGTATAVDRGGITVAAGDGREVLLEELQPEGRRPMSSRDFLTGHPLRPGTRLGRA